MDEVITVLGVVIMVVIPIMAVGLGVVMVRGIVMALVDVAAVIMMIIMMMIHPLAVGRAPLMKGLRKSQKNKLILNY
jgi:hypothetical protein